MNDPYVDEALGSAKDAITRWKKRDESRNSDADRTAGPAGVQSRLSAQK
ncbi:MAG: hypothetical protein INR71_15910 [Terriglobus roseus]|nr:hypothetical protein [Terriglobus roseus]